MQMYSSPPLLVLRGFRDERKNRVTRGGARNSGDIHNAPGYGILTTILSKMCC